MLRASLKLSALLILSNCIFLSEQQSQSCVNITKLNLNDDFSFAVAQVDDVLTPLGPQEACYFSCGGQIVTQSINNGDFKKLTLMDNAASSLMAQDFLKVGQVYFVNQLGMADAQGGNGIGCIEVRNGNHLGHYPRSHSVCTRANKAVCGYFGQQTISPLPSGKLRTTLPASPTSISPSLRTNNVSPIQSREPTSSTTLRNSSIVSAITTSKPPKTSIIQPTQIFTDNIATIDIIPKNPEEVTSRIILQKSNEPTVHISSSSSYIVTGSVAVETAVSKLSEILPEIETIENILPIVDNHAHKPTIEGKPHLVESPFDILGRTYHVISRIGSSASNLLQASEACKAGKNGGISDITSEGYQPVADYLKRFTATTDKYIIGSWNGDSYELGGKNCLILQVNHGIFPGSCTEAPAILCQQ